MPLRLRQSSASGNQALQQLFTSQEFSLANYTSQAQLYGGDGERECQATIKEIARRQSARAAEVGRLLATRRVFLQREGFPMCFTGLNDLSAAYVARRLLAKQPKLIAAIHDFVRQLHADHEGQVLARRGLAGEEENLRHLESVLGEMSDDAIVTRTAA